MILRSAPEELCLYLWWPVHTWRDFRCNHQWRKEEPDPLPVYSVYYTPRIIQQPHLPISSNPCKILLLPDLWSSLEGLPGRLCRSHMNHIRSPPKTLSQRPIISLLPNHLNHYDGTALMEEQTLKSGGSLVKGTCRDDTSTLKTMWCTKTSLDLKTLGRWSSVFPHPLWMSNCEANIPWLTWAANRADHQSLSQHQWRVPGVEWHQDPPGNLNPKPPTTTCWASRMKALRSAPLLHKVTLGWGSWVAHSTYVWAGSCYQNWKTTKFDIGPWNHSSYMWGERPPLNTSQWPQLSAQKEDTHSTWTVLSPASRRVSNRWRQRDLGTR